MGNFKIGQHYDEALRSMQPADIKDNLESIFAKRVDQEIEKIKDFVTIIEY